MNIMILLSIIASLAALTGIGLAIYWLITSLPAMPKREKSHSRKAASLNTDELLNQFMEKLEKQHIKKTENEKDRPNHPDSSHPDKTNLR